MKDPRYDDISLLYVEDDVPARERIAVQLSRRYAGIRILEAGNGAEGVAVFKAQRPDIVLTDLIMPVMDGIAMSEEIKAIDEDTLIVAVTASSDTDHLIKAIDAGITGYLLKPIVYEKLFALLDRKFRHLSLRKELARKNEYVRKLSWAVEHGPVSVVICDSAGTIEYVNTRFQELTGYRAAEVVGKNVSLQKSGETPVETYRDLWHTIRAGEVWQGEFLNRKKDGALYWEHASISPIFDEGGATTHYVAVKEDITPQKEIVRALQKSQRKFATLFHTVPALILLSTLEECLVIEANVNFLQNLQRQRGEIVGRTMAELPVWESEEERTQVVAAVRAQREVKNLEIRLRDARGNTLVGLLSTATFELDERSFLMTVIRDITERKEREAEIELLNARLAGRAAELERANSELEAFNSMIAHDLRNPLNVINSYSQVMAEMCGDKLDATCREYLQETYNGTLRMNRLIDALLDFSRLAHAEPAREWVDLSALAAEVVGELHALDPDCGAAFEIAQGVSASCDPALLRIVLHNLLGNAMKYNCRRGGLLIRFGVTEGTGEAVYFVRDNGIGFDPGDAQTIFQPFQRLAGPQEVQGHGIGLATVERIIKRHGGTVWADGAVGRGAAFFFTVPPAGGAPPPSS